LIKSTSLPWTPFRHRAVNAVIALRRPLARSCLVPLLLSALFSGGVPPASAAGYENCNNCQNCVYNGRYWSCKDPPGLVKDGKSDRWWLGMWVVVILVAFAVVSVIMREEGVFVPDGVLLTVVGLALVSVVLKWMGVVPGEVVVLLVGPALVLVVMKWMVQAPSRPIFPTYIVSNILGFSFGSYLRKRHQERTRELRFVYHDGYIERVTIGPGPEVTLAVELDPYWNSGSTDAQLKFSGILGFPSVRKYFETVAQETPDEALIGWIGVDEKYRFPELLASHVNTVGIGSITFHCTNVAEWDATGKPQFEVTDHHELAERGGFVIGHIREGAFRIGMKVRTGDEPTFLTIFGIEYRDNVALIFSEQPTLEFVRRVFPVGTVIEAETDVSAAPEPWR
jgi:hypothetical protein